MISRTIDIDDINQYIIDQLSLIFNKSNTKQEIITKKMNEFEHTTWSRIYGTVVFKKQESELFVNIYFKSCRFGYDFYNQNGPSNCVESDVDECCVCYENTDNKIMCGHRICVGCTNEIMNHSKTMDCPMCRKKHETNDGLRIKYPAHLIWLLFG